MLTQRLDSSFVPGTYILYSYHCGNKISTIE